MRVKCTEKLVRVMCLTFKARIVVTNCPFPGIDPYVEHPALRGSVHASLIVEIASSL